MHRLGNLQSTLTLLLLLFQGENKVYHRPAGAAASGGRQMQSCLDTALSAAAMRKHE